MSAPDEPSAAPRSVALGRATLIMGIGTTLSRITGFGRLAVFAWAVGGTESKLPDTYQLANTLPNIVHHLVIGEILTTIFVPVFVEYVTTRRREDTVRLSSSMMALAFLTSAVFTALTVAAAPWLIKIYSFRLEGAERIAQEEVGAFFLRLFMPQMIFYAMGTVITGLLNAHRRFIAPMYAPVLNNLVVIGAFVAFRTMHGPQTPSLETITSGEKLLLGLGTTAGVVVMTLAYLPAVLRLPGWFRLRYIDFRHPAFSKVGTLAKWSLAYVIVNQIGIWVVKALANGVQGGVAAYDNSFLIYSLPYGIVAVSVFTALVPSLAEHHVKADYTAFRDDFSLGLRMTSFVILPASAGLVALSEPVMRLLLEHGTFTSESTRLFADTFALMAIGLAAYAAFQQMNRAFYSMQDARTPWLAKSIGVAVNVATAVPLFFLLGVPGLGLSHTFSYLTALAVAAMILRTRAGGLGGRELVIWHLKVAGASVATGLTAWGVASLVGAQVQLDTLGGQIAQVGSAILAGIVVYLAITAAARLPELGRLISTARRVI